MLTIDRFESHMAVCEAQDGTIISIPRSELPTECKEGDQITKESGKYMLADSANRRSDIKTRFQKLIDKSI